MERVDEPGLLIVSQEHFFQFLCASPRQDDYSLSIEGKVICRCDVVVSKLHLPNYNTK